MADGVLVEEVFDFICSSGGFVEFSVLFKHPSPLGRGKSELEARNWLRTQRDGRFVVLSDGSIEGVRIQLKKKICPQYLKNGSCRRAHSKCKFWHICKAFIEGNCGGKCRRSHDFFDEENVDKIKQLGIDKYPNDIVKNIVAWSLPQVCQSYLWGECKSSNCVFLHVCSKAVQGSSCPCSKSHNLTNVNNKTILKQFDLLPHQSMSTEFVRCSILVSKKKRVLSKFNKSSNEICSNGGKASAGEPLSNSEESVDSLAPKTVRKPALNEGRSAQGKITLEHSCSSTAESSKQSESESKSLAKSGGKGQDHQQQPVQKKTTKQEAIFNPADVAKPHTLHTAETSPEKVSAAASDGSSRQNNLTVPESSCTNTSGTMELSESLCISPVKSEKEMKHPQPQRVQSNGRNKQTCYESVPFLSNNLANNSTSASSENSVEFMNIKEEDEENSSSSSSDQNECAKVSFTAIEQAHVDADDITSVKRNQQESHQSSQSDAATDKMSTKRIDKDTASEQTRNERQQKNSVSDFQSDCAQSVQETQTTDPDSHSGQVAKTLGKEVQQGELEGDATQDYVRKWIMGSDYTKGFVKGDDLCSVPTTKAVSGGHQRRPSVSSSCSSVPDPKKCATSKKAVFDCILKEYDGSVSFDTISKRRDLFPEGCGDITKWFGAREDSFLLRKEKDKISDVSVFCNNARLCFNQRCVKTNCPYFHVCREFISGFCRLGVGCSRNHSFQYDEDRKFISKFRLNGLTHDELRTVLRLSMPQVCLDYNHGLCAKASTCERLHICKKFIRKRCNDQDDCLLQHEIVFKDPHTSAVLQKYGLRYTDHNANSILRMVLVCESVPIGSRDYKTQATRASAPGKQSNGSLSVSSKRTTSGTCVEPSEMKVFDCLCKEYQCSASFSVICKRTDLFPRDFDNVEEWFRKRKGSFLITEDEKGKILQVDAYSVKARLCLGYNSSSRGDCKRENCFYLHVCKEYITDSCISGATCSRNHHFQDVREKALLSKVKLDRLTDEQLRKLVLLSTPQACSEYNHGICQRGDSCNRIHVCSDHLKRSCSEGNECDLDHESAMHSLPTRAIIERYHLDDLSDDLVKRIILVCGDSTNGKETGHIRQDKPEKPICSDFLLGKCKKGSKCRMHHCPLPFHWQYNGDDEWKSFNGEDDEKIEKLYCDENLEECTASDVQISIESEGFLFLDEGYHVNILLDNKLAFLQTDVDSPVAVRRLSTASYVTDPDNTMATQWTWYWKDEYETWRKYDQDQGGRDLQQSLEEAFLSERNGFRFRIADQDYTMRFCPTSDMSQTNVKYGTTRKVRRRPEKFVSRDDIQELRRSHNLMTTAKTKQGVKPKSSHLPKRWSPMSSKIPYKRVPLASLSDEFKDVEKLFRKSIERKVKIISIERVQNPFMWEKYQRKKENMLASRKSSLNEKQLFHGTNPDIVEAICKQNFDWRLHGKNATVYGEGSYFALNSSYSDAYAKADISSSKFVFVARVLVGSYAVGQSSYRRPPQKDPSNTASDLYDSCVNDRWSPTIFVVFDTDQCYPEYIIEYSAIIQTAHGGHHGNYQPPSMQVRASSSGSSVTGAVSSYASHGASTPSGHHSYTSGATGGLYHNRASTTTFTSGSSPYSSSASSTSSLRPSSNPPTRSTSHSGTSGYSGSSAYTGSFTSYSSASSSYGSRPSSSSPPRSSYQPTSVPTRSAEAQRRPSKEPKCLIM